MTSGGIIGRLRADRWLIKDSLRVLTSKRFRTERIGDITYRFGFSDISHFRRIFRAGFDFTPKAARCGAAGAPIIAFIQLLLAGFPRTGTDPTAVKGQ